MSQCGFSWLIAISRMLARGIEIIDSEFLAGFFGAKISKYCQAMETVSLPK